MNAILLQQPFKKVGIANSPAGVILLCMLLAPHHNILLYLDLKQFIFLQCVLYIFYSVLELRITTEPPRCDLTTPAFKAYEGRLANTLAQQLVSDVFSFH